MSITEERLNLKESELKLKDQSIEIIQYEKEKKNRLKKIMEPQQPVEQLHKI